MKTLYLECNMGAAGDMLMAALLELSPDRDGFIAQMNALGLPGVCLRREGAVRCGIRGTHVAVEIHGQGESVADAGPGTAPAPMHGHPHPEAEHRHDREHLHDHEHEYPHSHDSLNPEHHHEHPHAHSHHSHAGLSEIRERIDALPLPEDVRRNAKMVYARIAAAEAHVHGTTIDQIHFHEVGSLDAVADVVGVCLLMHELAPEEVVVSPIRVGYGQVRCAHGVLPVPAPATAVLLEGAPVYAGDIPGEMCTPTGAALLTHFATRYGQMPPMSVQAVGYGMGAKDFSTANCLRAMLGEAAQSAPNDAIVRLECNLDDITGEAVGFALDRLFEAGALDAFVQPIQMKKNRPGLMLTCICAPERADALAQAMLRHTTTLGVRRQDMARYALSRRIEPRSTPFGEVRVKIAEGFGVRRAKFEYADVEAIARRENRPFGEILNSLEKL